MAILLPSQITAIRKPSFDFNAGFLDRLAAGMRDFFAADGMLSAAESPGPLIEIAENYNLLVKVIEGAEERTTESDPSRTPGIQRLSDALEELDSLCRTKHGMSIAHLLALRSARDLYDAEFLGKIVTATTDFISAYRAMVATGTVPPAANVQGQIDLVANAARHALESPCHDDPAKAEAIERLTALVDDLRELVG